MIDKRKLFDRLTLFSAYLVYEHEYFTKWAADPKTPSYTPPTKEQVAHRYNNDTVFNHRVKSSVSRQMNIVEQCLPEGMQGIEQVIDDARKWSALMSCERFRLIGSGSLDTPGPDGHIGLELWTIYPEEHKLRTPDTGSREEFLKFINKALEANQWTRD